MKLRYLEDRNKLRGTMFVAKNPFSGAQVAKITKKVEGLIPYNKSIDINFFLALGQMK